MISPRTIPKTTSGKIQRSKVKQLYVEASLQRIYPPRPASQQAGSRVWGWFSRLWNAQDATHQGGTLAPSAEASAAGTLGSRSLVVYPNDIERTIDGEVTELCPGSTAVFQYGDGVGIVAEVRGDDGSSAAQELLRRVRSLTRERHGVDA
eukprot:6086168-Prymnesium_polylepis.1